MRRVPWLNIVLFVLTCMTTLYAGAMHRGLDPFYDMDALRYGIPYAVTLMTILLGHELGHYFASRIHGVSATLPYFIPVPPYMFYFGTMGALIRMKSPIRTRRALIDIGAYGPIVGFVLAIVASAIGLHYSEVVVLKSHGNMMIFGEPLIFTMLSKLVVGTIPKGADLILHPLAFAGWIGFFVTMLNLMPMGQLDGGHIVYALWGERRHRVMGEVIVGLLATAGLIGIFSEYGLFNINPGLSSHFWPGWLVWALLLKVMGLSHPPVYFHEPRLDRGHRFVGIASIVIFILTFMPVPVRIT